MNALWVLVVLYCGVVELQASRDVHQLVSTKKSARVVRIEGSTSMPEQEPPASLMQALVQRDTKQFKKLWWRKSSALTPDERYELLRTAVMYNQRNITQFLVRRGVSTCMPDTSRTIFHELVGNKHPLDARKKIADTLKRELDKQTEQDAEESASCQVMRQRNINGFTPFAAAAVRGDQLLFWFAEHMYSRLDVVDSESRSVLHYLCAGLPHQTEHILKELRSKKLDVANLMVADADNNDTPLHILARVFFENPRRYRLALRVLKNIVTWSTAAGCDVRLTKDAQLNSPLHVLLIYFCKQFGIDIRHSSAVELPDEILVNARAAHDVLTEACAVLAHDRWHFNGYPSSKKVQRKSMSSMSTRWSTARDIMSSIARSLDLNPEACLQQVIDTVQQ